MKRSSAGAADRIAIRLIHRSQIIPNCRRDCARAYCRRGEARERARRPARDWARRRGSRSFAAVRVVQTIAPTVCAGTVYRVCSKVNEVNSFFYDTRKITYHQPKPKFILLTLCLCRGANELRQYVHWESSPVASVWTETLVTEASSSRNIIIRRIHINGHDDFYRDTWINFLFLPIS